MRNVGSYHSGERRREIGKIKLQELKVFQILRPELAKFGCPKGQNFRVVGAT